MLKESETEETISFLPHFFIGGISFGERGVGCGPPGPFGYAHGTRSVLMRKSSVYFSAPSHSASAPHFICSDDGTNAKLVKKYRKIKQQQVLRKFIVENKTYRSN